MCRLKAGDWCEPSPKQRLAIFKLANELGIAVDLTAEDAGNNEAYCGFYPALMYGSGIINPASHLDIMGPGVMLMGAEDFMARMRQPAVPKRKRAKKRRKKPQAIKVPLRGYMGIILRVLAKGGRLYSPWDSGWYYLSNGGFGYSIPWNSVNALEGAGLTELVRDVGEDYYSLTEAGRNRAEELLASDAKKAKKEEVPNG